MPSVLFQGDYLGQAIQNLGDSFIKAGETVYDKFREAKTTSAFLNGQQLLASQVNQFNQGLAQDTDYDNYGTKWATYKDEAWGNAVKTVKDTDALNALNEWWNTQSIEQGKRVNEYAINGQMGQIRSDSYKRLQTAANRDLPFEQNDAEVNRLLALGVKTGVFHPDEAQDLYSKISGEMATRDFNRQGMQFLQQNGLIPFAEWVNDPSNVPEITDMSKRSLLANGLDFR